MLLERILVAAATALVLSACTQENPSYLGDPPDSSGGTVDWQQTVDLTGVLDQALDAPPALDLPAAPDLPDPPDGPGPPDLPWPDQMTTTPDQVVVKPDQLVLLKDGQPCTSGGQCLTGWCVDKVCCAGPCASTCMACNLSGKLGTCAFVTSGTDPRNDCKTVDPHNTCKLDGTCDGNGGCRFHPAGTLCKVAACGKDETLTLNRVCDGGGTCLAAKTVPCFPYSCDKAAKKCYSSCTAANEDAACYGYYGCNTAAGACYSSCTKDAHCNSKGKCDKGACKKS